MSDLINMAGLTASAKWSDVKAKKKIAQEWIPVTPETMPKDYGTYICTCFDGCANRVTFVKWQNKLKQWILNGSRSYWKVTAWMPLPEPYEEDDE